MILSSVYQETYWLLNSKGCNFIFPINLHSNPIKTTSWIYEDSHILQILYQIPLSTFLVQKGRCDFHEYIYIHITKLKWTWFEFKTRISPTKFIRTNRLYILQVRQKSCYSSIKSLSAYILAEKNCCGVPWNRRAKIDFIRNQNFAHQVHKNKLASYILLYITCR